MRALGHALGDHGAHPVELGGGGRAVLVAQDRHADVAVGDEVGGVGGGSMVDTVQVLTDAAPCVVQVGGAVPGGDLLADRFDGVVGDGGVSESVLAQDLKGDALADLGLVGGVCEEGEVGVGVHVDEAGCDDEAGHVDALTGGSGASGRNDVADTAVA